MTMRSLDNPSGREEANGALHKHWHHAGKPTPAYNPARVSPRKRPSRPRHTRLSSA